MKDVANDMVQISEELPGNAYFEFVERNAYFLSRSLVVNRLFDPSDTRYLLPSWPSNLKIVQFWDTQELPEDVLSLIQGWKNSVPEGCHILFNDQLARNFIMTHYPSRILDAYDHCHHPAMKSDYFRLAYLYTSGGFYIDADERCLVKVPSFDLLTKDVLIVNPISREIKGGEVVGIFVTDLAGRAETVDGPECYFANSPLFASPRNEIVRVALIRSTKLILDSRATGIRCDLHYATGPTNLTLSIGTHLIHSVSGKPVSEVLVIDWSKYAQSEPTEYKRDKRNWRTACETDSRSEASSAVAPMQTCPSSERSADSMLLASPIDLENVRAFTKRFDEGGWGGESKSGPGSSLAMTRTIRSELPIKLASLGIRTMIDAPCGDMHWMRHLEYRFDFFIGIDIVRDVIEISRSQFDPERFHFQTGDVTEQILPRADAIFCRDCLVHLPISRIRSAIRLFKLSGAQFLLTTTFPGQTNIDCEVGEWRPLDLQNEPFNWPAPIFLLREDEEGLWAHKSLGIWSVCAIPSSNAE